MIVVEVVLAAVVYLAATVAVAAVLLAVAVELRELTCARKDGDRGA